MKFVLMTINNNEFDVLTWVKVHRDYMISDIPKSESKGLRLSYKV